MRSARRPPVLGVALVVLGGLFAAGCADRERAADGPALPPNVAAEPYFVRGLIALRCGDPDTALFRLEQTLALDPDHARAYWIRAQVQFSERHPATALEDLGRALELDPDLAPARDLRAWILRAIGRRDEALAELAANALRAPETLDWWRDGTANTSTPEAAEETFARWIQGNGEDVFTLLKRGNLWRWRDQPERAWQDYQTALERRPDLALARLLRARMFLDRGRPEQAEPDLVAAVEADPGFALAHELLGWCRYLAGDPSSAEASLSRALALVPEPDARSGTERARASMHERRGLARFELGQSAAAAEDLLAALVLDPARAVEPRAPRPGGTGGDGPAEDFEPYVARFAELPEDPLAAFLCARALHSAGRTEEAGAAYARAVQLRGDFALARLFRAELHAELGEAELALAEVDAALGAVPDLARAANLRGDLRLAAGEEDAARADYEAAIALAPRYARPLRNLARALVETDAPRAIALLTRAIRLDPGDVDAYDQRAAAWAALGNLPAARRDRWLGGTE